MTDPCLTCPLPACNERDPRCAYRQSEEYQRIRALHVAQKKRHRDRHHAMRKNAECCEANRGRLVERAQLNRCKILWSQGLSTFEIAERIGVPESLVYNDLLPWAIAA